MRLYILFLFCTYLFFTGTVSAQSGMSPKKLFNWGVRIGVNAPFVDMRKSQINGIKIEERQKPRLTPHCTRHTFASLMDSAGMDKNILARIIGHTDPKTTNEYYIHKQSQELVQAMMDTAKNESNRESNV